MNDILKRIALAASCVLCFHASEAGIKLPTLIGDGMVLKQNGMATLWGWAEKGRPVKVGPSWTERTYTAIPDADGRWEVSVPTGEATFEPQEIEIIQGKERVELKDILIGEVWFCSGQSNMEMPLRGFGIQPIEGGARAIAYSGKYPGIRVHTTPKLASYTEQKEAAGSGWKHSCPADAGEFSATAYFFATALTDLLEVPVGLVVCSYGGSKLEGWMPERMVKEFPEFNIEKEKADGGMEDWQRVTVMYNAMLKPLVPYTLSGFLWNQGESNVGMESSYAERQKQMAEHWRELWGDPSLPFYFVEIPGWNYDNPEADNAARFREAQHKAAEITDNCEIVCTSDLVYDHEVADIHACKKRELGERLAFMAAAGHYGIEGIHADYPTLDKVDYAGNKAVLKFHNRYGGFTPNIELPGFEVAGDDRVFYPAKAVQNWQDYTVTVSSPEVEEIKAIRYCFKNFARGQVHDMLGLPLVPFRTDNW